MLRGNDRKPAAVNTVNNKYRSNLEDSENRTSKYSGDLNTGHLDTGQLVIQFSDVQYSNGCPVFECHLNIKQKLLVIHMMI